MNPSFAILDAQPTPMGELTLRRRRMMELDGRDVYEVKLGEEFLMSSLFHAAEDALADLGLASLSGERLDVVVGGLGLGYTAAAALRHANLGSLLVVDALAPVIAWHREGLVPLGATLVADPRCRFVHGDFFAMADEPALGFDPQQPGRRFDAVLVDIDHSPVKLLRAGNRRLYEPEGLSRLARHLKSGGLFALWSDDPPNEAFVHCLRGAYATAVAHIVTFANPLTGGSSANTIYVAISAP